MHFLYSLVNLFAPINCRTLPPFSKIIQSFRCKTLRKEIERGGDLLENAIFLNVCLTILWKLVVIRLTQGWNTICSQLGLSISHYLLIQRDEISFSARHQGINDILALKSITVSSFSSCPKHEDITVKTLKWVEEMKTLQCLHFLSITHGVMTYVCIIVFIYLSIVLIWDLWIWSATLQCHLWHGLVANQNPWASNDNNTLKMNIVTLCCFSCIIKWYYVNQF